MKKKFLIYASMLLNTVNVDQAHALQWSSRRTFYFPEHPYYHTLFSAPTAAYYLCILNLLKARCKLNYSPSPLPLFISLSSCAVPFKLTWHLLFHNFCYFRHFLLILNKYKYVFVYCCCLCLWHHQDQLILESFVRLEWRPSTTVFQFSMRVDKKGA